MAGLVIPMPKAAFFDNDGNPLAGGLLYAYVAGTLTPKDTFTTSALDVANVNPVILDSSGRATIYLTLGEGYKFVLKTSAGVSVWTQDNVMVPAAAATPANPTEIVVHAGATAGSGGIAETTMQTYTLPGATLAANGNAVRVTAQFDLAANGNNKQVRLYFGATVIADTGVVTVQTGGVVEAMVVRTGAATQIAWGRVLLGGTVQAVVTLSAPTETLTGDLIIKLTGESAGAADISGQLMIVETLKKAA